MCISEYVCVIVLETHDKRLNSLKQIFYTCVSTNYKKMLYNYKFVMFICLATADL